MHAQHPQQTRGVRRRELLKAGLVAGVTLSARPLARPPADPFTYGPDPPAASDPSTATDDYGVM